MTDIYIDGSFRDNMIGYGVRVELNGGIEHYGNRIVNPKTDNSLHEYFAFIEAARLARHLGIKPADCHIITDLQALVYGSQGGLDVGHSANGHRPALLKALIKVRKYYPTKTFNDALVYLTSRFSWQPGHCHCVGNRRADHLATNGRIGTAAVEYDKWLKTAYSKHINGKQRVFFVPFTASRIERDGLVYALAV